MQLPLLRTWVGVAEIMNLPTKKYSIIYADPPWRYDFSKSNSRKIENQYPTMSLEEIKSLPVRIENNAVCYLWATAPKLIEALEVLKAWGFQYKTHAIWDKESMGMGYWFRGQHELLLVGTKGKFSPPNQKERKSSVFRAKRTKHSKKPFCFKSLISLWFPKPKKIELFARERTIGGDSWGDELRQRNIAQYSQEQTKQEGKQ